MKRDARLSIAGLSVAAACLGIAVPGFAQEAGAWASSQSPGAFWGTIPALDSEGNNILALFAVGPASPGFDWKTWSGPSVGANSWSVVPAPNQGLDTDMRGTWVFTGADTAELRVEACTRDCGAFVPGATIAFTQLLTGPGAPPPPTGGVTPGTYETNTSAFEACLNVSADGTQLTTSGSGCDNGNSLDIDMQDGTSSEGGDCNANVNFDENIAINGSSFTASKTVSTPFFQGSFSVSGTFSGTTVSGTFSGQGTFIPGVCTGNWSATLLP